MSDLRQTVAGAFAEIEKHEAVCAERYGNIQTVIGDMRSELRWITRGVISLLVAVAAWALIQVWNGHPPQTVTIETPNSIVQTKGH